MRGHLPLVAMRKARTRPSLFVSIDVGPMGPWLADNWHTDGLMPCLLIEPKDTVSRLDLRFLIGLDVNVSGYEVDAQRVRQVFDACLEAGAARVMAGVMRNVAGEVRTVHHYDSKGEIEWQE